MRAARWLLVLVSMGPGPSELRVARGLASGALDFPLVSPVQRRMNCKVGPWENVSNGGSLCGRTKPGSVVPRRFKTQDRLKYIKCLYLSIQNGFPRGSFLANGAVLHSLHWHFIFPIQQLQPPVDDNRSEFKTAGYTKGKRSRNFKKKNSHLFLSKTVICATKVSVVSPSSLWNELLFFRAGVSKTSLHKYKDYKTILYHQMTCWALSTPGCPGKRSWCRLLTNILVGLPVD